MADNNIPPPAWLQDWLTQRGATSLLPTQSQPPQIAVDAVGLFKALGPRQRQMFPTLINDDSTFPGDGNIDSFGEGTGVGSGTSVGDSTATGEGFGQPVGELPGLFDEAKGFIGNQIDQAINNPMQTIASFGANQALGKGLASVGLGTVPAGMLALGIPYLLSSLFGGDEEPPISKQYESMLDLPIRSDPFYNTVVKEPDRLDPFDSEFTGGMSMSQTDPAGYFPSMEDFGGMGPESDDGMDADEEGAGMDD